MRYRLTVSCLAGTKVEKKTFRKVTSYQDQMHGHLTKLLLCNAIFNRNSNNLVELLLIAAGIPHQQRDISIQRRVKKIEFRFGYNL